MHFTFSHGIVISLPVENILSILLLPGTIIEVIRVIGIIVTVISLMLLGIKYMTGSVEEKADYKKTMIPYLIGVVIFFSLSTILTTIRTASLGFIIYNPMFKLCHIIINKR